MPVLGSRVPSAVLLGSLQRSPRFHGWILWGHEGGMNRKMDGKIVPLSQIPVFAPYTYNQRRRQEPKQHWRQQTSNMCSQANESYVLHKAFYVFPPKQIKPGLCCGSQLCCLVVFFCSVSSLCRFGFCWWFLLSVRSYLSSADWGICHSDKSLHSVHHPPFLPRFWTLFYQRFLFFKNVHWKFHQGLRAALLKPQKGINRPKILLWRWLGAEQLCTHCIQSTTFVSAYSDTAAVMSCSRRSQYVKSWIMTNRIQFSLYLFPAILQH